LINAEKGVKNEGEIGLEGSQLTCLSDVPVAKNNLGLKGVHHLKVDSENVEWSLMSQPNPKHKMRYEK
jgi:hypothetical protein